MKKTILFGALACALQSAAADDLKSYDLGTLVVTPTRTARQLDTTLQSITVITPDDIAQAGQQTLPELLQTKGNVEVKTVGGPGQPASIFIRGANSTHTLVLIDGIRLDNITSGATALEHIPLSQIERIEILRAPGSSLYGADAIGGVIQVFTKNGKGVDSIDISAGYGAYQTADFTAGIRRTFGNTRLQINFGHNTSQAFSATNARAGSYYNPDKDPYRNTNVTAKLAHSITPNHEIGLSIFESKARVHFDGFASTLDDTKIEKLSAYSLFSKNRLGANWQSLVKISKGIDDYRFINTSSPSSTRSVQDQITWQNDFTLSNGSLSLGLEYLDQHVTSTVNYDVKDRTVKSAFGVYQAEWGSHGLQLSARHDDNSQFGKHETGNISYGYRINPAWRVTGAISTAFKAPNFQDLYYPGFSNPNLKPERSMHHEVGVRYAASNTRFSATYFVSLISDLIVFTSQPVNINKADIDGVELSLGTLLAGFDMNANFTTQNAVDGTTGKRLQLRSETFGSLAISRKIGAWRIASEAVASGNRFDSTTESSTSRLPGYATLNLTSQYSVSKNLTLQARWNNIFDKQYELAKGYNTPGSNLYVGLRYQIQ